MQVEALTDRDGQQANTITKMDEMLQRESFPPNDYDQFFELSLAGQEHQSITEHVIERAPFSQSVRNAPGPDTPLFGAIRLLLQRENESIVELAKAAIQTGRHPAV